jgi:hypothetical protein
LAFTTSHVQRLDGNQPELARQRGGEAMSLLAAHVRDPLVQAPDLGLRAQHASRLDPVAPAGLRGSVGAEVVRVVRAALAVELALQAAQPAQRSLQRPQVLDPLSRG